MIFLGSFFLTQIINQMGVALFQQQANLNEKNVCWRSTTKPISLSMVCGFMLFVLGMISLLTGHMASNLEWYSQRFVHHSFYSTLDGNGHAPIDIWKSQYSKYYYGCKERGRSFASAVHERKSNGYLLIATSGGLNQQRTGITDAVVVARILNATLVLPELDHHSFWKDDR
ncbi:putative GDP-fucose protein O-fucosyltransferase [Lupinus albus]|uniref:O-fucosyltransferase family protein n=1 Tax=Lupinus albus TaxID=3870 RepID=A0A6A4Q0Z4_LUPAL|nr:putative GDP-fucose protein O-fucosyltransferase [Lupinus albus]